MSVKKRREAGFTLIELMITVVIIALLAGIALPAYQGQVVKSRRTDTQRVLVSHAQSLERWFSTNGTYLNAAGTACGVADPSATTGYTLATRCTATTFTVEATVVTGGSQASDGNQSLSNTGVRTGKWAN